MTVKYSELYFGKSDSRNEANEDHEEFVRSYVDLKGTVDKVISGEKFLVLGPKGTGKSALAWYLQLTEHPSHHLTLTRDASLLPLAEVPRLQTGQMQGPERTVVAWKFILYCNYLELLLRDQGCTIQRNNEALRVARQLRRFGFMGDTSGRALLKASTSTTMIPVPKLGQLYKRESRENLNIYNLLPYMEEWISLAESGTRHVLVIDGLDSIFLNDSQYDESLSSLVQAAYDVNQKLRFMEATGSIVLLLRNDVFARISSILPDSQKMRDDLSENLDWRVLSGKASANAPLFQLVNRKAARALGVEEINVLHFFPKDVQLGGRSSAPSWINTVQYLLNLTRHTPRDLLRLLEEIRKVDESGTVVAPVSGRQLSLSVIREGVLQYSKNYFVGAIRNEFAGYEDGPDNAERAIKALKEIAHQEFDRNDFIKALSDTSGRTDDSDRLLTLLFFAGAIGNQFQRGGERYLVFYHRRDEADVHLRGKFVLHNALVHAWSLTHARL